ncbi:MAG: hypothetical protein ABH878_02920 [bacterium]
MSCPTREILLRQGWKRAFTIETSRTEDLIAQYLEIGFEAIAIAPTREDLEQTCGEDCFTGSEARFRTIFIKSAIPDVSKKESSAEQG